MKKFTSNNLKTIAMFVLLASASISLFFLPKIFSVHYTGNQSALASYDKPAATTQKEPVFVPSYVSTPHSVKGIYMTSWVAGTKSLRDSLVKIIDTTEINTVVIDIKDYSGKIVFKVTDPKLQAFGSEEVRVDDMRDFIESLHKKGVYVIGRVAVFQDAYFVKHRPDLAVRNKSGTAVWKDRKGISWIDAGSKEYWDYIIQISNEARKIGFDEINFDYIRFPSDGNMQDISFPFSSTTPKHLVLKSFFSYLNDNLRATSTNNGLKISADLFGMVTTASDDMGIGQLLEDALPYFDYVSPMVYPSHYPPTFMGYKDPEAHPYEVIKYAMQSAVDRREALASSTGETLAELRPWLQDFGLRMNYGPSEVKSQIKATNEVGLDSWLLWSASNRYTLGALNSE